MNKLVLGIGVAVGYLFRGYLEWRREMRELQVQLEVTRQTFKTLVNWGRE